MSWVARIPEIFSNCPLIYSDSMLNSPRMRKVKSLPLYLPPDLRNRVELIAQQRRRAVSPQIVLWVEKIVTRIERREQEETRARGATCRA